MRLRVLWWFGIWLAELFSVGCLLVFWFLASLDLVVFY